MCSETVQAMLPSSGAAPAACLSLATARWMNVRMKRLGRLSGWFASALLAAACGAPQVAWPPLPPVQPAPDWDTAQRPIIIGHRGASDAYAPENTMPAFDIAANCGAAIETDIQTSADGIPVLIHDDDTLRTTGKPGKVAVLPASVLRQRSAAALTATPAAFVPIPLLQEYLARYAGHSLLAPEIKAGDMVAIVRQLRVVAPRGVLVHSFGEGQLQRARELAPELRLELDSSERVPIQRLAALGVWSIGLWYEQVTVDYVAACHELGIRVIAWTVNDLAIARRLVTELHVDGIVTDNPAMLVRALHGDQQALAP